MSFDFPNSPTTGQAYNGYTWDGEKWVLTYNAPNTSGVIAIQVFTTNGTYTPSANMTSALIECLGGGGGGGGVPASTTTTVVAAGGGTGGYSRKIVTAATVGTSQVVTIGVGGARGSANATPTGNGGLGGDTSVGTLCLAKGGGSGGGGGTSGWGGAGGSTIGAIGDFIARGASAESVSGFQSTSTSSIGMGGTGASSMFGGGGGSGLSNVSANGGGDAYGYGSGGGGASSHNSAGAGAIGGLGSPGLVIITEYGMTALSSTTNSQGAVRFDVSQGLSASQQLQGRQNVYAAPFDALAYNGMQINGACEISQENGSTQIYGGPGGTTASKYIADGWMVLTVGAQSISWQAGSDLTSLPGYSSYVAVWANVANTAPAAGDVLVVSQRIEGYRTAHLGWGTASAQPISIGFWFYSNVPGTYSGAVRNSANNRSYVFTFSVSASTWQWQTVTIPGDVAGTWNITNAQGLEVDFTLMSGTTYQTAPGGWAAVNAIGATGTFNAISNVNMRVTITGLIVLPGTSLPSSTRAALIQRSYDQELLTCRRYWRKNAGGIGSFSQSTTVSYIESITPTMRVAPTVALISGSSIVNDFWVAYRDVSAVSANAAPNVVWLNLTTTTAGGTINKPVGLNGDSLSFDARL